MRTTIWLLSVMALAGAQAHAAETTGFWDELRSNFDSQLQVLAFDVHNGIPQDSPFNPGNRLALLPSRQIEIHVRPDLTTSAGPLSFMAKPRAIAQARWTEVAGETDKDTDEELFVNEWRIRVEPHPSTFLSYGREVLLWGPSMFVSLSNPFFLDNGRNNPKREIGGKEFVRASYVGDAWTTSALSNTGQGRYEDSFEQFESVNAAKVDYTGPDYNFSLIAVNRERDPDELSGYGQITASDALLLYAEGTLSRGSGALYPRVATNPVGAELAESKRYSDDLLYAVLTGAAYTFEAGPTINIEYVYNQFGYDDAEASQYYALVNAASSAFVAGGADAGFAAMTLGQAATANLLLLRRHYVFVQFLQTQIRNQIDVTVRYARNLDDGSGSFVPVVDWNISDHLQLFLVGAFNHGGTETEFGRFVNYQVTAGIKYFAW
jgi:hypothetical protein